MSPGPEITLRRPRISRAPVHPEHDNLSGVSQDPPTSATKAKNRAVLVKTEPVDDNERDAFCTPSKSGAKAVQSMRISGPIVVSSEESDPPTPKARPAKSVSSSESR